MGLWAGLTTTEPGLVSGWHHHGGHDTIVYVISASVAIEFGEGGQQAIQAGAEDFLVIPSGLIHRESTPGDEPSRSIVIRAGGDGPPTIEVDGPRPSQPARASTRSTTSRQNRPVWFGSSTN
jgi:uncharacterized RmlC-like cupin family protein